MKEQAKHCYSEVLAKVLPVLKVVHQLPQNILGALVYMIGTMAGAIKNTDEPGVYYWDRGGGISLGRFIFIDGRMALDPYILKHEQGHQKQSLLLGWLYLPVIGLPSFVWACLYQIPAICERYSYYDFYTEAWAEKWGKVNRGLPVMTTPHDWSQMELKRRPHKEDSEH